MRKRVPIGEPKQCTVCKRIFPYTPEHFHRKYKGDDLHLFSKCKNCERKRYAAWRRRNPAKARERCNRWYHNNIEKARAQVLERVRRHNERRKQGVSVS